MEDMIESRHLAADRERNQMLGCSFHECLVSIAIQDSCASFRSDSGMFSARKVSLTITSRAGIESSAVDQAVWYMYQPDKSAEVIVPARVNLKAMNPASIFPRSAFVAMPSRLHTVQKEASK